MRELLGDACAHMVKEGSKAKYPRIGLAMQYGERVSVKIDSLPINCDGYTWTGWINIFPRKSGDAPPPRLKSSAYDDDDNTPF